MTWHDGNGHSHVRATLVGPSLTIPVVEGAMQLGTWQQVIFLDFDNRSRERGLLVQVFGTKESGLGNGFSGNSSHRDRTSGDPDSR